MITAAPEWLSCSPVAGIIPAGGYEDITVTMNAAGLEDGSYEGAICILSNDLTDPEVCVPVYFNVGYVEAMAMDIDPNTLNLSSNGNWIECNMMLPEGYDPGLFLCETTMLRTEMGTVSPADRCEIEGPDGEGHYNVHLKFDRAAVEDILPEGDSVVIEVAGELDCVTYVTDWDAIKVIRPKVNHPNGGEYFHHYSNLIVAWEVPDNFNVDTYAVYFSANAGESWAEMGSGITAQSLILDVPMVESEECLFRVYAFQGDEVVGYDTSDDVFTITSPTGAGVVGDIVPTVFALRQNAPNPFAGTTMLRFDVPKDVKVKMSVFDIRGRLVKSLVDETLPAGRYSIGWDGRDSNGDQVASGVYFYKIQAGQWNDTKRMVLVR
jgi:hypothetical protein